MDRKKISILLFQLGFGIKFSLIGVISISELFLLLYSVVFFYKASYFLSFSFIRKISILYLLLFFSQVFSELIVGNSFANASRGLAITFFSYFHFIFLFSFFYKDYKLIITALIGLFLRFIIFGSEYDEASLAEISSGGGAAFIKFYLTKIVMLPLLIYSAYNYNRKNMAHLIFFVGLAFVFLGSRSAGSYFALTGVLGFLVIVSGNINLKKIYFLLGSIVILGYGLYVVYVDMVLSGQISSGNSLQILKLDNPYNPFMLIALGRTYTLVGWIAFMDNFWFGHGAWAIDFTGKYSYLMATYNDYSRVILDSSDSIIPSHSVLIGYGMQNGVFSFTIMFMILYNFIKLGVYSLHKHNIFLFIIVYSLFFIFWNGLFSPMSHFRNSFPLYFAIISSIYLNNERISKLY